MFDSGLLFMKVNASEHSNNNHTRVLQSPCTIGAGGEGGAYCMFVCMCVYVCVCVCVCMYMYVCMHVCMYDVHSRGA